jgi:hypothetical protein
MNDTHIDEMHRMEMIEGMAVHIAEHEAIYSLLRPSIASRRIACSRIKVVVTRATVLLV